MRSFFYVLSFPIILFLISCNCEKKTSASVIDISKLEGSWELEYISSPVISFNDLYSERKPTITFDVANKSFSGNTSCNNYNGPLKADGNKISFADPMAMTRMMCQGSGETEYLEILKSINTWSVSDSKLNLLSGDIPVMRFRKKTDNKN